MKTQVYFAFNTPEVKEINGFLREEMPEDDRIDLADVFLDVFFGKDAEFGKVMFGNVSPIGPISRMGTLLENEFRIWHSIPGHISRWHANSCGTGLIFSVIGSDENVQRYAHQLMPTRVGDAIGYQEAKFPYSHNVVIRNVYECFRMLGEAILFSKGIKSSDHILPINELISFAEKHGKNLKILDSLRRLRHNINYYAYSSTESEANEAIKIAKDNFNFLADKLLEELRKKQYLLTPNF